MATLQNVKLILGITDNIQDDLLNLLIKNVTSHLTIWLKKHAETSVIPTELDFIVEEMTVVRFNRIGSENYKSESVDGRSISFNDDDFAKYRDILDTYIPVESRKGKVLFY